MRKQKNHGFSMLEVLVTLAITVVGLLGLGTLQLQANRSTQDTGNRSQAVWMIEDLTNRVRANADAFAEYDSGGVVDCGSKPVKICTSYNSGSAYVESSDCLPKEVAISDLWEVACGFSPDSGNGGPTRSSPADFIANPKLIVSTDTAARSISVTLSWDVRTSGTDSNGKTVYMADSKNIQTARAQLTTVFYP